MSPHQNKHPKTRDGYIIEIELILNLPINLPLVYYRLDIESAAKLDRAAKTGGRDSFIKAAHKMGLPVEEIKNAGD